MGVWSSAGAKMYQWACRTGLRPVDFAALNKDNSSVQLHSQFCDLNAIDENRWGGSLLHFVARQGLAFATFRLVDAGYSVTVTNSGILPQKRMLLY